jgi:hypothetical protein
MPRIDPILAERRKLGALRHEEFVASTMTEAHHLLGKRLRSSIAKALQKRLNTASRVELRRQFARIESCRDAMERRLVDGTAPLLIRRAIKEYIECLHAWAEAADLMQLTHIASRRASRIVPWTDLALWSQHDNTGCQTGMLRQPDGSVLFWHTEEDTYGYFDKPRIATFRIGDVALHAFLYSYLLPGPAFGWRNGQFHALDSLHLADDLVNGGLLTSIASWLIWRLGPEVDPTLVIRSLLPYMDGCAINVIRSVGSGVEAAVLEFGGRCLSQRRLAHRPRSLAFQVNAVSRSGSALGRREQLTSQQRRAYVSRTARTLRSIGRLNHVHCAASPHDILTMLASRGGGGYAYANRDVKAHCIGCMSPTRLELYVQSGAALRVDKYAPRWQL